jgi:hypothetical protein
MRLHGNRSRDQLDGRFLEFPAEMRLRLVRRRSAGLEPSDHFSVQGVPVTRQHHGLRRLSSRDNSCKFPASRASISDPRQQFSSEVQCPLGASRSFDTVPSGDAKSRRSTYQNRLPNPSGVARKILKSLVGAGRFERPTPCAQGIGVVSNSSIAYFPLPVFPTRWGTCFSLEG